MSSTGLHGSNTGMARPFEIPAEEFIKALQPPEAVDQQMSYSMSSRTP